MSGRRENAITAAASVIERILWLVPSEYRQAALATAAKQVETPPCNAGGSEALMVRVVYLFVRDIVENHSAKDASLMLFREQGGMPGSGQLLDYLEDLPRPRH